MKFISTRNNTSPIGASGAILNGIADDGGLYIAQTFPQFTADDFGHGDSLSQLAQTLLADFFAADPLQSHIGEICQSAFNFPVPVKQLDDNLSVLELFHGPTAAFKDFGARFLAQCFEHITTDKHHTILVATSGDTGGAVGHAFEQSRQAKVIILYPKGRVSPLQQQQLTCWGGNVSALQVDGDFDDCQRLVKQAFANKELSKQHNFASANSINIARLLPQMSYYAFTALRHFKQSGCKANFIIPTGNMGNGMAALWARACGIPIGKIVFASNANQSLFDYYNTGVMTPQASITTLANAMDVGNPSNFERFAANEKFAEDTDCKTNTDAQIKQSIVAGFNKYNQIWCPHTACAYATYQQLPTTAKTMHWYMAATAHPYKFSETIEPLIAKSIVAPPVLEALTDRHSHFTAIKPTLSSMQNAI